MTQSNRPQPNQPSPATSELKAIREDLAKFRQDFDNFSKTLSRRIAFGIIGSLILSYIAAILLTLMFHPF